MKSLIKAVLLISLCVSFLHAKSHLIKQHETQNVFAVDQATAETTEQPTQAIQKVHHVKKGLRMHRHSNKDAYDEIKRLEAEDKKVLEEKEAKRLALLSDVEVLNKQCTEDQLKLDQIDQLVKQEEQQIQSYTSTKTTYEATKLQYETQVVSYQKDYNIQESTLKELQGQLVTKTQSTTNIKVKIDTQKSEIIRLQQQLEIAIKEQKTLEAQLVLETTQMTDISVLIQKQTVKCTDITTCITKKQTEIDVVAKQVTESSVQITNHTSWKKTYYDQWTVQKKKKEDCNKKKDDTIKDIDTIKTSISNLKMRICAYFSDNKLTGVTVDSQKTTTTTTQIVPKQDSTAQASQAQPIQPIVGQNSANIVKQQTLQSLPANKRRE